jgi:predicted dinucleotide-binding enzyme
MQRTGFSAIDLGGLREGGEMRGVQAPLTGVNLIRLP